MTTREAQQFKAAIIVKTIVAIRRSQCRAAINNPLASVRYDVEVAGRFYDSCRRGAIRWGEDSKRLSR